MSRRAFPVAYRVRLTFDAQPGAWETTVMARSKPQALVMAGVKAERDLGVGVVTNTTTVRIEQQDG